MPDVLNPDLYNRLCQRFGTVKIHNPGQPMQGSWFSNFGKKEFRAVNWGEVYGVNCFACANKGNPDTRHRLSINHRWGVGPTSDSDNKFWHLAVCYNNGCHTDPGFYNELKQRIYGLHRPSGVIIATDTKKLVAPAAVELPGLTVKLSELEIDHVANKYLLERGFDPYYLADVYGVGYCYSSNNYPMATGRIIAPFYKEGQLIGWQGRYVGEAATWKTIPKYYTMPGGWINHTLYDMDTAKNQSPNMVFVCEGITDVWRLGVGAVALCGKTVKGTQEQLLSNWETIILLLDSDALKEINSIYERLSKHHKVVKVILPEDKDPGSMGMEIFDLVYDCAEQQGIELP
jgi:5S rRNA maturation endonuclease (ribonuclease M5)